MPDPFGLAQGGQRSVIGDRRLMVSGRELVIPGLATHPDIAPPPNGRNQEFLRPLSNEGLFGTVVARSAHGVLYPSHLYIETAAAAAHNNAGIYLPSPAPPFTLTAKWTATTMNLTTVSGPSQFSGIFVGVAGAPGAFLTAEIQTNVTNPQTSRFACYQWTNPTTFNTSRGTSGNTTGLGASPPLYLRLVVTSSTNIAAYYSFGGFLFVPIATGVNPGITIASFGAFVNSGNGNAAGIASIFDWLRITTP